MPFKYACFISYSHSLHGELAERFMSEFYNALRNEISLNMSLDVFIDPTRLQGGQFFSESLAKAICESVCMVTVLTPVYFNRDKPYTAREYRAMELLEKQRLELLPPNLRRGLIIPVVLRGAESLPSSIRENRQYHDFSNYLMVDQPLSQNPRYAKPIFQIAKYIYDLYRAFDDLDVDLCSDCDRFNLPTEEEARKWLERITISAGPTPFPGR